MCVGAYAVLNGEYLNACTSYRTEEYVTSLSDRDSNPIPWVALDQWDYTQA